MIITSAKYGDVGHNVIIINGDGASVPVSEDNTDYQKVLAWVAEGNTIDPYVPPPEPTLDELVDEIMTSADVTRRALKSLILCLNDGTIVPGAGETPANLKQALKSKM